MTLVTLLALPIVIAAGTAFGAVLRRLSRAAQTQNARALALADEALGNIRTVRAFGAEDYERAHFKHELDSAQTSNELLGVGIAVFQAGTNLVLNGM